MILKVETNFNDNEISLFGSKKTAGYISQDDK
jgi:hypothetical protein